MGVTFDPSTGRVGWSSGGGGGISIGDAIGSGNANRLLYTDDSGNLADSLFGADNISYFAGAVTGSKVTAQGVSNSVDLQYLNLSGIGQPNAIGVTVNGHSGSFYFIDVSTLTPYMALLFDYATPGNRSFVVGLASGISSTPELSVSTTEINFNVPLSMNSNKVIDLDPATGAGEAVEYAQMNTAIAAVLPSQTGNSGKFLTTNGSAVSWGVVSAAPGGSNTQVQFNDSSVLGGDSGFTFNKTTNEVYGGRFRSDSGSTQGFADTGGNGSITFGRVGNDVDIYGYTQVNFYDGSSSNPYLLMTRSRFDFNPANAFNVSALGAGQGDNSVGLMPNNIGAWQGIAVGVYISGGATATANNDVLVGTMFRGRFTNGGFTGLTRIGVVFDGTGADVVSARYYAHSSQSVDITQWTNNSGTLLSAIAKNGAFKPASLADSAAENNTVYYSTTQSKLVYKDSGGTVNVLY